MSQLIFKFPFKTTYYENDFYVSSNNFEAYKLVESWPNWPGKHVNIFGPSGCGKTHLTNILRKKIKSLFSYYITYILEASEFVNSTPQNRIWALKELYAIDIWNLLCGLF